MKLPSEDSGKITVHEDHRLFYSDGFDEVFSSLVAWLLTARALDGVVASAEIDVLSNGFLHNYIWGCSGCVRTAFTCKEFSSGVG